MAERELKVLAKVMENELMDCFTQMVKNELMDCLTKLVGKIAAGMTRTELVMNELMGSTANEEFERRIAASWCGSRVAGWRTAVVKTSASLVDKASLASKAPLVSLDTKWNVTCIMQMTVTHSKRETNVMLVTAVLASMVSLAPMASMASMASMVWMASMASMVMASMASRASIVGVTALRWRILRSETLVNAPEVLAVMRWILKVERYLSFLCWDRIHRQFGCAL